MKSNSMTIGKELLFKKWLSSLTVERNHAVLKNLSLHPEMINTMIEVVSLKYEIKSGKRDPETVRAELAELEKQAVTILNEQV